MQYTTQHYNHLFLLHGITRSGLQDPDLNLPLPLVAPLPPAPPAVGRRRSTDPGGDPPDPVGSAAGWGICLWQLSTTAGPSSPLDPVGSAAPPPSHPRRRRIAPSPLCFFLARALLRAAGRKDREIRVRAPLPATGAPEVLPEKLLDHFLSPDQRFGLRRPSPVDLAPLPRRRRRLHRPLLPLRPCGMARWPAP